MIGRIQRSDTFEAYEHVYDTSLEYERTPDRSAVSGLARSTLAKAERLSGIHGRIALLAADIFDVLAVAVGRIAERLAPSGAPRCSEEVSS